MPSRPSATIFSGVSAAANRRLGRLVDAGIGRLRREHDGDQQGEGVDDSRVRPSARDRPPRRRRTSPRSRRASNSSVRGLAGIAYCLRVRIMDGRRRGHSHMTLDATQRQAGFCRPPDPAPVAGAGGHPLRGRRSLSPWPPCPGFYFLSTGLWPIVGVLGLATLALWWAARASRMRTRANLRGGDAVARPTWRSATSATRGGSGVMPSIRSGFAFTSHRDIDDRVTRLTLDQSRSEALEIGAFLNPDDKASFARAFGAALQRNRA